MRREKYQKSRKGECSAGNKNSNWKQIKRAIIFARPYRWYIILVLLFTLMVAGLNVSEPLVMKFIFDQLSSKDALQNVFMGIGAFLVLLLFREGIAAVSNWLTWKVRLALHYNLLDETVERIHRLPTDNHQFNGVGSVMMRLDKGIQGFIGAISEILFNIFPAIAYLAMATVIMFKLDWRLTVVTLIFAPIPAIIASIAAPAQASREQFLMDKWAKIYARFQEVLSGIITVRSFAMEDYEKNRFLNDVGEANKKFSRGMRFDQTIGATQNLAVNLGRIAAITMGTVLIFRGEITLGTLIAFLGYVGGFFAPIQALTTIYRVVTTAAVSLDHVFSILDSQSHLGDDPQAVDIRELKGNVKFNNLCFSYKRGGKTVLNHINLNVNAGETIALVGPSGAGKSTLMALLQRFYDPITGNIELDGIDLRLYKQQSLRRKIGVVHQEPQLFNESIRDNIAYGRPEASQEEIIEAAKKSFAHNFITQLEKGYDTIVGERGRNLSVGEKQRIAIARTILKDPSILILDEATAVVDAESEFLIRESLDQLMKNRTTFKITHRFSTVVNADRIMVLKNGVIIDSGTHRELMDKNGYYAHLVGRQVKGMIA